MGKYIRLLRLQDQYVEVSAALMGGLVIHSQSLLIIWWAIAAVLVSVPAYIFNEIIDHEDVDKYSWNTNHIRLQDRLDSRVVLLLFILFSVVGLFFSWRLGLFGWGLFIWVFGILYSFKPVRLKRRFVLDLAGQLFPFLIIPFLAVVWGNANTDLLVAFLIVISVSICSMLIPYQLADYDADKKAGFSNTHVVLGMAYSLELGIGLAFIAIVFYFLFEMQRWALWLLPIIIILPTVIALYIRWIRMPTNSKKITDMQHWIRIYKPITQLMAVYLFIVWRFV